MAAVQLTFQDTVNCWGLKTTYQIVRITIQLGWISLAPNSNDSCKSNMKRIGC